MPLAMTYRSLSATPRERVQSSRPMGVMNEDIEVCTNFKGFKTAVPKVLCCKFRLAKKGAQIFWRIFQILCQITQLNVTSFLNKRPMSVNYWNRGMRRKEQKISRPEMSLRENCEIYEDSTLFQCRSAGVKFGHLVFNPFLRDRQAIRRALNEPIRDAAVDMHFHA